MKHAAQIQFRTFGAFQVLACDGTNLTPKSLKACGLLALLLSAPDFRRPRSYLQDKLWSDREQEQGATSLRQSLAQIRRSFGHYRDVLLSDGRTVGLDPSQISSDLTEWHSGNRHPLGDAIFLEDIDIRDPEFESWLRDRRQELENKTEANASGTIKEYTGFGAPELTKLFLVGPSQNSEDLAASHILQSVASGAAERGSVDIRWKDDEDRGALPGGLCLDVNERLFMGRPNVQMRLLLLPARKLLWHISETLPSQDDEGFERALQRVVNIGVDRTVEVLSGLPSSAAHNVAFFEALQHMFQSRGQDHKAIRRRFSECYEREPRGVYLAWQAFLSCYIVGERRINDTSSLKDEARDLMREAIRMEPHNALVLALASHVHGFVLGNFEVAHELANKSVTLDSKCVLGWTFLGTAKLFKGNIEEAYSCLKRAHSISGEGPYRHLVDGVLSAAAILSGRLDEGIQVGETLHAMTPDLAPALRFLIAAYLKKGDYSKAEDAIQRLRKLEPDFQLSHFAEPDYPVPALRNANLLDLKALPKIG